MANTTVILHVVFGCPMETKANYLLSLTANRFDYQIFTDSGRPLPTPVTVKRLVDFAKYFATAGQKLDIIVVAAPPHKWRVLRDLRKMAKREGVKLGNLTYFETLHEMPRSVWFNKESIQWWTRSPWLWWPYELLVRMIPFSYYLKLAERETAVRSRGASLFKK